MNHHLLPSLARFAEDTQLEAKFLFPDSTEKQLRWCAAKGMLETAKRHARPLRTAKDSDGEPVFPDIMGEIEKDAAKSPHGIAKMLYATESQLLEAFGKYGSLLKTYSTHSMIEFMQDIWPNPGGSFFQKPKGVAPPGRQTVIVRPVSTDGMPAVMPGNGRKRKVLRPDMLRIGNFVSVQSGSSYLTVRVNWITRRKIGYTAASGTSEKYVRIHEAKPLPVTGGDLTALLGFRQVDQYFFDGKNYYEDVYQEKILGDKADISQYGLFGIRMAMVRKYELFPDEGVRTCAFIISDIGKREDCFVKLETTTMAGGILQVYYPVYIHEVQNFISFFLSIKDSHAQVYLDRKRQSGPSDFD